MANKMIIPIGELDNFFYKELNIVTENVAKIVRDKLEEYIKKEFYELYRPLFYDRTYMFLRSPKFNVLSPNSAQVFIDTDVMHYLGISGEDVANMASFGFHGSIDIFRPGYYWTDFIAWSEDNIPRLYKEELSKLGFNVK